MSAVISEELKQVHPYGHGHNKQQSMVTAVLLPTVWRPMQPLLSVRAATTRGPGRNQAQVAWVTRPRLQRLYVVEQMGTG